MDLFRRERLQVHDGVIAPPLQFGEQFAAARHAAFDAFARGRLGGEVVRAAGEDHLAASANRLVQPPQAGHRGPSFRERGQFVEGVEDQQQPSLLQQPQKRRIVEVEDAVLLGHPLGDDGLQRLHVLVIPQAEE